MPTLAEIAMAQYREQGVKVTRDIAARSGILRTMLWEKSSHGAYDKDSEATTATDGGFRQPNAGYDTTPGTDRAVQTDLFPFGDVWNVDRHVADNYPGGIRKYIKDKAPLWMRGLGAKAAAQMVYGYGSDANGFMGLRQIAIANGNTTDTYTSGSGTDYTAILAVRWEPGVLAGLYSGEKFMEGMRPRLLNNGSAVLVTDADGNYYPAYQVSIELTLGVKSLGAANVAALLGVKDATNYTPTSDDIEAILADIHADPGEGNTYIYCNRTAYGLLGELNGTSINTTEHQGKVFRNVTHWDGVPIIIDNNITQTESRAS